MKTKKLSVVFGIVLLSTSFVLLNWTDSPTNRDPDLMIQLTEQNDDLPEDSESPLLPLEPETEVDDSDQYRWDNEEKKIAFQISDWVKKIDSRTFNNLKNVYKIHLPEGLEIIEDGAFSGCADLTEITIPSSVKEIGRGIFDGCVSLKSDGVVNNSTVLFDWWVKNYSYDVQPLGEMAEVNVFNYTNSNRRQFTRIGAGAFASCDNLEKITIPHTITSIGTNIFWGSNNLKPENVINNSPVLFEWWVKNHEYENGTLLSIIDKENDLDLNEFTNSSGQPFRVIDEEAFLGCDRLNSLILPHETTRIGYAAFAGNLNLKAVHLPDSLIEIGESAFEVCTNLERMYIPDRVTHIGASAFNECESLESISFPKNLQILDKGVVANCLNLHEVILPKNLIRIEMSAFYNCSSIFEIELPDKLVEIGENAFKWCKNLTKINLPETLTKIGPRAFKSCLRLATIKIPSNVLQIDDEAFANCRSLKEIVIPQKTSQLGNGVFAYTSRLTKISILTRNLTYGGEHLLDGINHVMEFDENSNFPRPKIVWKRIERDFYVADPKLRDDLVDWRGGSEHVHFINPDFKPEDNTKPVMLVTKDKVKNGRIRISRKILSNIGKLNTALLEHYAPLLREIVIHGRDTTVYQVNFKALPQWVTFRVFSEKVQKQMLDLGISQRRIRLIKEFE